MIAVIADDFTGAAEIGGMGLRNSLQVVIETNKATTTDTDLLIMATDTRSYCASKAGEVITKVSNSLLSLSPDVIYKKIDSVFRGNIAQEIIAQMKVTGKKRAVIIAANPVFKRFIKNGEYFIEGKHLHKTCFSNDPQYPIGTSDVLEIIGETPGVNTYNLKPGDALPKEGLIIGDVESLEDLKKWANSVNFDDTLLAGASGFFNAVLQKLNITGCLSNKTTPPISGKTLFVFGSTFPKGSDLFRKIEENNHYLSNMPKEIYFNPNFDKHYLDNWVEDIEKGFHLTGKVIVTIGYPVSNEPGVGHRIKNVIGELLKKVLTKVKINELLIEGGSTTSVVLDWLDIYTFYPVQEMDTGVIRMQVKGDTEMFLTTKPGSYNWPVDVWEPHDTASLTP